MTTIKMQVIFTLAVMLFIAAKPIENKNLIGKWQLVRSTTNGKHNPEILNDRTWEFLGNNTFIGKIILTDGSRPYNQGLFFLPNDTTMITLHSDPGGKMSKFSYTYNFHVRKDSLHLYGFYFRGVPSEPAMLQLMYIDEWWVKSTSQKK